MNWILANPTTYYAELNLKCRKYTKELNSFILNIGNIGITVNLVLVMFFEQKAL